MKQYEREALSCKRRIFSGLSWNATFSVLLFRFFPQITSESSSNSLMVWHVLNQYYSTWISKSNLYKLASWWRQFRLLMRWRSSSFWLSSCFRFSIMNAHFIPSDNTVQNLIFITVKCSFAMMTLIFFGLRCFGTSLALALLIPIFLC